MYIIEADLPARATVAKVPNKHQRKTEVTRRKLLHAALRIFARDGFEAARIEAVSHEAGYSRGAFYAQFKSKEDLFFALLEEQATLQLEALRAKLESCSTNGERLQCLRTFYVARLSDKQWAILLLEFKLYALRHPKLRAKLAATHRTIRNQLKLQTIAPLLPAELTCGEARAHLQQTILQGLMHGVVLETAYDPTGLSEAELVSMLGEIFDVVVHRAPSKQTR